MLIQGRHCAYLPINLQQHLKASFKEDIMTFLEWMLDTYTRVRKQSTVHAYKRILFQIYRKSVGKDFSRQGNDKINNVSSIQSLLLLLALAHGQHSHAYLELYQWLSHT